MLTLPHVGRIVLHFVEESMWRRVVLHFKSKKARLNPHFVEGFVGRDSCALSEGVGRNLNSFPKDEVQVKKV